MSASPDLDAWLRSNIEPVLRAHGYRGGPRRFHRSRDDLCTVIQFQGSLGNVVPGECRFVVNVGVWSKPLSEATGDDRRRCPSWTDCHIGMRVGELGAQRAEIWWDIGAEPRRETVRTQLLEALRNEALPFLDTTGTPEGFKRFWQEQGGALGEHYVQLLDGREPSPAGG